jgi:tellurite methyltransferase
MSIEDPNKPLRQKSYAELSHTMPPSSEVIDAVELVQERNEALDLGAGSLRNAKYLLEKGFHVVAVDRDPVALEISHEFADPNLEVRIMTFSDFEFPTDEYDLLVAKNALPFATPEDFPQLWKDAAASIKSGGVFYGTFFGPNDTWASKPEMTFLRRDEVQHLFPNFEILKFEEEETDAFDIQNNPKHWHIFKVTARKR